MLVGKAQHALRYDIELNLRGSPLNGIAFGAKPVSGRSPAGCRKNSAPPSPAPPSPSSPTEAQSGAYYAPRQNI